VENLFFYKTLVKLELFVRGVKSLINKIDKNG